MAATATLRTFWGALLSVLLKCVAALGFTTAAARTQAVATHPAQTPASAEAGVATAAVPAARGAGSSGGSPASGGQEGARVPVPAPRLYEPLRRDRDRLLPPTMRQRITAEAHGATPAGRSLPAGTFVTDDGYGGLMTVPAPDADDRGHGGRQDRQDQQDRQGRQGRQGRRGCPADGGAAAGPRALATLQG